MLPWRFVEASNCTALTCAHRSPSWPQVLPILKPVDKCWQPADFLPPSEDPDFLDKVHSQPEAAREEEGCA